MKHYRILFEGKQQAIAILKKGLNPDEIKQVIKELETYDPTSPKNKYLEMFAKIFYSIFSGYKDHKMENPDAITHTLSNLKFNLESNKIIEALKDIEKRQVPFDVTKIKTFQELFDIIEELEKTRNYDYQADFKSEIKGLKANKDYIEIPLPGEDTHAFIPLHLKASRIIASKYVGGCEGKWCTAYTNTDKHWVDYIEGDGGILIYTINTGKELDNPYRKIAIYIYKDFKGVEYFDANDKSVAVQVIPHINDMLTFAQKNQKKIYTELQKHFTPKTLPQLAREAIEDQNFERLKTVFEKGLNPDAPASFSGDYYLFTHVAATCSRRMLDAKTAYDMLGLFLQYKANFLLSDTFAEYLFEACCMSDGIVLQLFLKKLKSGDLSFKIYSNGENHYDNLFTDTFSFFNLHMILPDMLRLGFKFNQSNFLNLCKSIKKPQYTQQSILFLLDVVKFKKDEYVIFFETWQNFLNNLIKLSVDFSLCKPIFEKLIKVGVDINKLILEGYGSKPEPLLIKMITYNNYDCFSFLLEHGADPTIPRGDGKDAETIIKLRIDSAQHLDPKFLTTLQKYLPKKESIYKSKFK